MSKIPDKIKVKNQEFVFTKGSKLIGKGTSKEKVKEDAKYFRRKGYRTKIKKIEGKHYLYVGEKNLEPKKVSVVKALM